MPEPNGKPRKMSDLVYAYAHTVDAIAETLEHLSALRAEQARLTRELAPLLVSPEGKAVCGGGYALWTEDGLRVLARPTVWATDLEIPERAAEPEQTETTIEPLDGYPPIYHTDGTLLNPRTVEVASGLEREPAETTIEPLDGHPVIDRTEAEAAGLAAGLEWVHRVLEG